MPELPPEIWTMVAEHLKREPPPVGGPGNWNDHLHQQDLVNMLRVNTSLYAAASAVLYRSPVVQNMGLFLTGLDEPYGSNGRELPNVEHKRTLLGKVRKLYVVHASSNRPLGPVFMTLKSSLHRTRSLTTYEADELGKMDLRGWQMTRNLVDKTLQTGQRNPYRYRNPFTRLETVSFGAYDDGRWETYDYESDLWALWDVGDSESKETGSETENERRHPSPVGSSAVKMDSAVISKPARKVCPNSGIAITFQKVFAGCKSLIMCHDSRAIVTLDVPLKRKANLTIVHQPQLEDIIFTYSGPTRIYTTTKGLYQRYWELGALQLCFDDRRMPFFRADHDSFNQRNWSKVDLEICLGPEIAGDAEQLQLARDVRDALEVYKKACIERDGIFRYAGRFEIIVGGEIPACPCCGRQT